MLLPFEIESKMDRIRAEVENRGAELIELSCRKYGGRGFLTVIVDKPGGITLEECAEINGVLGALFDEFSSENAVAESGGFLQGPYFLEVNSPGLDRPLKTEKDFLRARGDTVRVVWREESGQVNVHMGEIEAVSGEAIELKIINENKAIKIPLLSVTKAVREIKINK